jgi:Icc-related predicted phosphoesterase
VFRVAAAGDIHIGVESAGHLRASLASVAEEADVLLLAGDLTKRGELAEGSVLAEELRDLSIPVLASPTSNRRSRASSPRWVSPCSRAAGP